MYIVNVCVTTKPSSDDFLYETLFICQTMMDERTNEHIANSHIDCEEAPVHCRLD
jgi:hypothetical protein